jgi:uncharacterized protein YecE (DUF72 family)
MAVSIRVGTCSWADESLSKWWYPKGIRTAEERLRHYSERFDTVELDATYYRLPEIDQVRTWVERTPPGFLFHVKAFGMMTRHPVRLEQLPPDLREGAPVDARGRVDRPPRELREEVFRRFHEALEPFREAGKLGGILLQFPSYVVPKAASNEYLAWAVEQLRGDEPLVEFRHRDWFEGAQTAETLSVLEELGAAHVIVDAPKTDAKNLIPTVLARTSKTVYLRFHGRNADTWNVRGTSAAQRFDYLYSDEELAEWVAPLEEVAEGAEQAFAVFNNNGRSPATPTMNESREWVAQAPLNALTFKELLGAGRKAA